MYNSIGGDRGTALVPYRFDPADRLRTLAWSCVAAGAGLVTAGMAFEAHNAAWLIIAALGLICAGFGYVAQQLAVTMPWSMRQFRSWLVTARDQLSDHDGQRGTLLLLAAILWVTLTLATAMAAALWGDLAGLTVICVGGLTAILIEIAARHICR